MKTSVEIVLFSSYCNEGLRKYVFSKLFKGTEMCNCPFPKRNGDPYSITTTMLVS